MAEAQIQIEQLRHLYATKQGAQLVLNYAARLPGSSSAGAMAIDGFCQFFNGKESPNLSRRNIVTILRAFSQAGCGRFLAGRHGQRSRFIWAVAPATLLSAVLSPPRSNVADKGSSPSLGAVGMFTYSFRFRPGLVVSINLPDDMTTGEADRLARFIQSLPFSGA